MHVARLLVSRRIVRRSLTIRRATTHNAKVSEDTRGEEGNERDERVECVRGVRASVRVTLRRAAPKGVESISSRRRD
jgi:hypothetical protein